MKTTKKIFAAVLAVMMIALMIPFSASAATTLTVTCNPNAGTTGDKADYVGTYEYKFFKLATVDTTTGTVTVEEAYASNADLVDALNSTDTDKSKKIITTCDGMSWTGKADKTVTFKYDGSADVSTQEITDLADGIYYVYCSKKPGTVKSVQGSLISLPYFDGADWKYDYKTVNLASKINVSGITVTKTVADNKVGTQKNAEYTLTASTAGSIDNQLKKYEIVDTMDEGLTFNENSVVVKYDGAVDALTLGTDYSIEKNYTYTGKNGEATATFAVVFESATLESEEFYNAKTVVVTYTADLNEKAKLNTAIRNTDGLVYGNDSDTNFEPGKTSPDVFTYGMKVVKVNGNDTTQKLADAEFQIFTDAEAKTPHIVDGKKVVAKTDATGEATFVLEGTMTTFKFDAKQTYYAKEIAAPTGYNLNSSVFTVSIDKSKEYTFVGNIADGDNVAVANYPVTVPKTGGMGTMMFYVGGAALIACAGVLLFVLKRKKAAK